MDRTLPTRLLLAGFLLLSLCLLTGLQANKVVDPVSSSFFRFARVSKVDGDSCSADDPCGRLVCCAKVGQTTGICRLHCNTKGWSVISPFVTDSLEKTQEDQPEPPDQVLFVSSQLRPVKENRVAKIRAMFDTMKKAADTDGVEASTATVEKGKLPAVDDKKPDITHKQDAPLAPQQSLDKPPFVEKEMSAKDEELLDKAVLSVENSPNPVTSVSLMYPSVSKLLKKMEYPTLDETYVQLDRLVQYAEHLDLLVSTGSISEIRSVTGNPIHYYRIRRADSKKKVLIISGIHGSEKLGVFALLQFMEFVITKKFLLEGKEPLDFVFIPVANPDGFVLGSRKNANYAFCSGSCSFTISNYDVTIGKESCSEVMATFFATHKTDKKVGTLRGAPGSGHNCDIRQKGDTLGSISQKPGTDINRNFPTTAHVERGKSCRSSLVFDDSFSPNSYEEDGNQPYAEIYEPETRALMDFASRVQFSGFFSIHSGSNKGGVIIPEESERFPLHKELWDSFCKDAKSVPSSPEIGDLSCGGATQVVSYSYVVFVVLPIRFPLSLSFSLFVSPPFFDSLPRCLFRLIVGSSRVDLQACKLEYSIVSPK